MDARIRVRLPRERGVSKPGAAPLRLKSGTDVASLAAEMGCSPRYLDRVPWRTAQPPLALALRLARRVIPLKSMALTDKQREARR